MQHARINNELSIYYQDYYRVLNQEEISKMMKYKGDGIWALQSEEAHCILMIGWEKKNSLLMKMTDLKKITEANIRMVKKMIPDYQSEESKTIRVGGNEATLTAYHYTKENLGQSVRTVMMIHQNTIYNISFYCNSAYIENNDHDFKTILEGIEII